MPRRHPQSERKDASVPPRSNDTEKVKISQAATYLLDECRMILPGIQALLGFQLIAVFSERFARDLPASSQKLHFVSLSLVALAIAIVMSPAAYHRMQGVCEVSERFVRNSSRLLLASMVPLALGLCIDYYIIASLVFDAAWAAAMPVFLFVVLAIFWIVFPVANVLQQALDRPATRRLETQPR